MFAALPQVLKDQVTYYLATDNFVAAKAVHDDWLALHQPPRPPSQPDIK